MKRVPLLAVVATVSALIVVLDYWLSAELLGALLFALPLALCVLARSKWLLWSTAAIATILTAAAGIWSFHRIALVNPWIDSVNRALLVGCLLTLSTLIHFWMDESHALLAERAEWKQQSEWMTGRNEQLEAELVKLKSAAKNRRKPQLLTVKQFQLFVAQLSELHRTMVVTAMCSGVRVTEVLALRWEQVDFAAGLMYADRAFGGAGGSEAEKISLDPVLTEALMDWRSKNPGPGLVFPSHITGRCYHPGPIQQDYFRPAARKLGLAGVSWPVFADSYRSWLHEAGAASGAVQQKLMRHADTTVMNIRVSGTAKAKGTAAKREPQSKIGRRTLPTVGFRVGVANVAHSTNNSQSG